MVLSELSLYAEVSASQESSRKNVPPRRILLQRKPARQIRGGLLSVNGKHWRARFSDCLLA
jgi:hypothetical protein